MSKIESTCPVPTGIDPSRCYRRFLQNSPRLFITHTDVDSLGILRVLLGSKGKMSSRTPAAELRLMNTVTDSFQVNSTRVLQQQITVGGDCVLQTT